MLDLSDDDPVAVVGHIDSLKLRSCMTLFSLVPCVDPAFSAVLDKYYGGQPDQLTLEMLGIK